MRMCVVGMSIYPHPYNTYAPDVHSNKTIITAVMLIYTYYHQLDYVVIHVIPE
jgi:hypothetical protein